MNEVISYFLYNSDLYNKIAEEKHLYNCKIIC